MKAGACFEIGNIVIMNSKTIIGLGFCLIIIFMKNNEDLGGWYHVCKIHNSSYHTSLNSFMLNTWYLICISFVGSGNQLSSSLTHYVVPDCQVCDTL